jgi:hypothetical protein
MCGSFIDSALPELALQADDMRRQLGLSGDDGPGRELHVQNLQFEIGDPKVTLKPSDTPGAE